MAVPVTCYAGETVRFTAQNLTHADSGSVTDGATVVATVYAEHAATPVAQESAIAPITGDDWHVDIDAPTTPGRYVVKIVAILGTATWKAKTALIVRGF